MDVTIPTLSMCTGKDCTLKGRINGASANILVDTGAAATVLSKSMWDRVGEPGVRLQNSANQKLVGVQGSPLHLHGSTQVQLELPPEVFNVDVIVADTPTADVILGRDFLHSQRCTIEMGGSNDVLQVQTRRESISITQERAALGATNHSVVLQESMTVPYRLAVKWAHPT